MEVLDVKVEVTLAVEAQRFFEHRGGRTPGVRLTAPAIEGGEEAVAPVLLLPAPRMAGAHAQNLGGLDPVIFSAAARKITSCTFTARPTAVPGWLVIGRTSGKRASAFYRLKADVKRATYTPSNNR